MVSKQDRNREKIDLLIWSADDGTTATISDLVRQSVNSLQCERSQTELDSQLQKAAFDAIIIDIDSLSVSNKDVARIANTYPQLPIVCISEKRLHPELEESISKHIFACVSKPIDPDEFDYWLKCIRADGRKPFQS
jgi:CheY-like chemotaxis protein